MAKPDPQRQQMARSYARIQRRLYFVGLAVEAIVLVALWPAGLSVKLAGALALPYWVKVVTYMAVLMAGYGLLTLPLSYYGGLVLPRRYGLSTQRLGGWLSDRAKGAALGLVLGLGAVLALYWLLNRLPGIWWLAATGIAVVVGLLMTQFAPLIIVPLFFKMKPLGDAELTQRLLQLAARAKARVTGVYTIDMSRRGTTANAALMGLGRTRRIVLGDTLLQSYTPDEVEVVMAHELGHHLGRHIIKLEALQGLTLLIGLYLANLVLDAASVTSGFRGPTDVAAFPVLAAVLGAFMMAAGPPGNAYSRRLETEADRRALALTGKKEAFVSLMTKLTDQNLSEAQPGRWEEIMFYSHPPYYKRVRQAGGAA